MRRRIPSLSALVAIESAGRLASFSRAAQELGVTQGAISRQISALETEVGAPLFERSSFGVCLTPVGTSYLERVRGCLTELEEATEALRARQQRLALRVAVPPTFAARWLVPRLAGFPGGPVDLSVRADPLTASDRLLDGEITFAERDPDKAGVHRLTSSCLLPVCASAVAAGGLIELGPFQDWRAFRSAYPRFRLPTTTPHSYDYYDAGIQAAILGSGLLLAPSFLLLNELKSGALRPAFPVHLPRSTGYFFRLHSRRCSGAVNAFIAWVRAELEKSDEDGRDLFGRFPARL